MAFLAMKYRARILHVVLEGCLDHGDLRGASRDSMLVEGQ